MRIDGRQLCAAALAALSMVTATGAAAAATVPLNSECADGVLLWNSDDGQFKWWLDGRFNLDGAFFIEDRNPLGDGVQLRRARLAFKTIQWGDWYTEMDVDFAEEIVAMKDAYVRYDNLFGHRGYVRAGNFREPFGFEENTSSRNIQFQERSQGTDGFVPGRKMGLEVAHFRPQWRVAAGVFGPELVQFETEKDDMTWNYTGRVTANFLRSDHGVLHLGLAGSRRQPQFASGDLRFRTRNEYHVNNYKYVDTDNIGDVDNYTQVGGEFAYVNRRLRVQSEYMDINVTRLKSLDALQFGGGYVCASYFLTDDAHPYVWEDAEFGKLVPKSPHGALEVLARYSFVDLTDRDVLGGESKAFTLALNWYANANIRIYNSWVMVDNDKDANAKGSLVGDDDYQFYQFRLGLGF
jgi:phosphate-selective porin OprO and OprP